MESYYSRHKDERKLYYQQNKERISKKKKEYNLAHKDEIRAKKKAYRESHKEYIKSDQHERYVANKGDYLEHNHKYYVDNRDSILVKQKEYSKTHREQSNATHRMNYTKNKEGRRMSTSQHRLDIKIEVLTHYGNNKCACVKCGFDNIKALSIDHINGDGAEQRRNNDDFSDSRKFYRWLIKNNFPEGYQTLCMNCQWIKRWDNKEHSFKNNKKKG